MNIKAQRQSNGGGGRLERMSFKYGVDTVPPPLELCLFALQWLFITLPALIIIGRVAAGVDPASPVDQVAYMQKVFFVTAVSLLLQLMWGHRLPLIVGPSSVLLVGLVAAKGGDINAIYSAIWVGGLIVFLSGLVGILGYVKKFFTPRVISVILLLVSFTLAPTIISLITTPETGVPGVFNFSFAMILALGMLVANRYLKGIWKATLIMWSMALTSLLYFLIFPQHYAASGKIPTVTANFLTHITTFKIDPGILISFLLCFLALVINDLGSIQSTGELVNPGDMPRRIAKGITVTGLGNALAGMFGVIGLVDFSLSPGVIASTGCASRYTLIPVGIVTLIFSFSPLSMGWAGMIPDVVIGAMFIYILCSQIAAGFLVLLNSGGDIRFEDGLVIGLPLMLGIVVSFLPASFAATLPPGLKSLVGNGFVVGVVTALILDNIYKR